MNSTISKALLVAGVQCVGEQLDHTPLAEPALRQDERLFGMHGQDGRQQEGALVVAANSQSVSPSSAIERAAMASGNPGRARTPAIRPPSFSCINQVF